MREPDFVIGEKGNPYLLRWWIIPRNRWFNVYLHKILRDYDDRALHDHPWWNVSIVLRGAYREVMVKRLAAFRKLRDACLIEADRIAETYPELADRHRRICKSTHGMALIDKIRRAGSVVFRRPDFPHRLVVEDGPVWTLFITGPRVREWGFHTESGWVHWRDFCDPDDPGLRRDSKKNLQPSISAS